MIFEKLMQAIIPKDANYHGAIAVEGNPNVTVIEYDVNGVMGRASFNKKNLSEFFQKPVIIPFVKGMTKKDIYTFIDHKYNLGLVEGIDYPEGLTELVKLSTMIDSYPVLDSSYGYIGYFPVFISDGRTNIIHGASNRDVRDTPVGDSLEELKIQVKLGWKLFTSSNKMFSNYMPSITFRNMISEYLNDIDGEYLDDILYGHIEKTFNDGLSDCLVLRTPMGRRYVIRFVSSRGDIPKVK